MSFYTFVQNNSGGVFTGPAHYVIVEADSADEANIRAEDLGIYFDGCVEDASGYTRDCPCCGDRWHEVTSAYAEEKPMVYNNTAQEAASCGDNILIVYADGREELYNGR